MLLITYLRENSLHEEGERLDYMLQNFLADWEKICITVYFIVTDC